MTFVKPPRHRHYESSINGKLLKLASFKTVRVYDGLAYILWQPEQTLCACSGTDVAFQTLSPFITDIFNAPITAGHSSTAWNTAVIKPLITKLGTDQSSPTNYRQVRNLPLLSKILGEWFASLLRHICQSKTCFHRSSLRTVCATLPRRTS